jgi:uncharacterized protein YndB with AHSA1/START domain
MPYDFKISTLIPASPQEIYDAWLNSLAHSEMTGSEAVMSDEIGAEVSAWDGYITGRNLELVPAELIVQSWRTTEFADDHQDSIIRVTLEEADGGTLFVLLHSNVPDEQTSYEQGGWQEYYFEPMQEYFAKAKRTGAAKKAKAGARKSKVKRAVKTTKAKGGLTPKAKAAPKKKLKRAVAAKPKPKRAGGARRKPARAAMRRR